MYYLREHSLNKNNDLTPVYQKLEEGCLFQPDKTVSFDFANTGVYEQSVIRWSLDTLMDSGKDFVDIGAHVGTWTVPFAKKVKCHSFECSPRTYNFLCANLALNNLDYDVKTYNIALGDTCGTTSYFIRQADGGGNGCMKFDYDPKKDSKEITVPLATLDSFNLNNIGFIKIDVEGFELNVLQGSRDT